MKEIKIVYRKGTDTETRLTLIVTLRESGRFIVSNLTNICHARFNGGSADSLKEALMSWERRALETIRTSTSVSQWQKRECNLLGIFNSKALNNLI